YIMLQSCKSMFCYIELTLISLINGICNGRLRNVCVWAFAIGIYNGRLQHIPSYRWLSYIAYPKSD
ncbi:hypothetical protein, partial [uncultured Capnocytophaga sp.]|uniref:hypothetical protein n=1 Tax=uncultured Capnocytophaga sp. TaxID=159273 RepID=UPI0025950ECE